MLPNTNDQKTTTNLNQNKRYSTAIVIVIVLVLIIGVLLVVFMPKKNDAKKVNPSTPTSKNTTVTSRRQLTGVIQKLELASDGKSGILFLKSAVGSPIENKPMIVYQVHLNDSVLVNSISPAKSPTATKPLTTVIKWTNIKSNKYANVNLNQELGSSTTVEVSQIKDIEVIEN